MFLSKSALPGDLTCLVLEVFLAEIAQNLFRILANIGKSAGSQIKERSIGNAGGNFGRNSF